MLAKVTASGQASATDGGTAVTNGRASATDGSTAVTSGLAQAQGLGASAIAEDVQVPGGVLGTFATGQNAVAKTSLTAKATAVPGNVSNAAAVNTGNVAAGKYARSVNSVTAQANSASDAVATGASDALGNNTWVIVDSDAAATTGGSAVSTVGGTATGTFSWAFANGKARAAQGGSATSNSYAITTNDNPVKVGGTCESWPPVCCLLQLVRPSPVPCNCGLLSQT